MESLSKGGLGGLVVSILMMILKWKQGDAPSPELYGVAAASGIASILSYLPKMGGDKDIAGIIQMVTVFLKSYGTGAVKVLYDGYQKYGIPVFAEGRISWGKGKTVPFKYGTDPELEGKV